MNKNRARGLKKRKEGVKLKKVPHCLILTDGEKTERFYFEGLRAHLAEEFQSKLGIEVISKGGRVPSDLRERYRAISQNRQYAITAFVFDRDFVPNFDQEVSKLEKENNVIVGWSSPCFETWLSAYFGLPISGDTPKHCVDRFKRIFKQETKHEYNKTNTDLYDLLIKFGNEQKAIERAKNLMSQHEESGRHHPSEQIPGTTVYKVVEKILEESKKKK